MIFLGSGREIQTAVGDNRSLPSLSGADRLEAKIRQIQKANRTRQMVWSRFTKFDCFSVEKIRKIEFLFLFGVVRSV